MLIDLANRTSGIRFGWRYLSTANEPITCGCQIYIYPCNWYLIRNRSSLLKSSACNPMQSNEEIFLENRTLHNTQRLTHRRMSVELLYETRKFQLVSCRFSHHKMKKTRISLSLFSFFLPRIYFSTRRMPLSGIIDYTVQNSRGHEGMRVRGQQMQTSMPEKKL